MRIACLLLLAVVFIGCSFVSPEKDTAPADMVWHNEKLYVAEEMSRRISVIEPETGKVFKSLKLNFNPVALAVDSSGDAVFVCGGGAKGELVRINGSSGKVLFNAEAGHTPSALVFDPNSNRVFVAARFSNQVLTFNAETGEIINRMDCIREPVALVLAGKNNHLLLVGNHLPLARGTDSTIASEISVFDTNNEKLIRSISLPNGSNAVKAAALSGDGKFAYFTHALGRYPLPTTQVERGWMNTAALSIINCETLQREETILLDDMENGFAIPWDVAVNRQTGTLAVSSFGTDEVIVMNENDLHRAVAAHREKVKTAANAGEELIPELENTLSFCADFRRRIRCNGRGARALVLNGGDLYIGMYYTGNLNHIDLKTKFVSEVISGTAVSGDKVRLGEALFNDAGMCFQQWQACATCHPDARMDALHWDLLNDGMGNHKNTRSLLLSHHTPPVMSRGVRDKAETAVRAGMHHIQFIERPEEDAQLIDYYLSNLQPVQSPHRNRDGSLTEKAKKGERIFHLSGCASCHNGPHYTDGMLRDVGTGTGTEKGVKFDTPTLIELWRTAPYLHDGRALTVKEAITTYNHGYQRGNTKDLSEKELEELVEFLLSL